MACQVEQQGAESWAEVPGAVQHMAYECPGLHGKGSRQDIRRVTFARLFGEDGCRMVVPLFQRAYCWGSAESVHKASCHSAGRMTSLVDGWWRDVSKAAESSPHSVGKVILKRDRDRGTMLCLDGQQRCTTNMLLLASIQDAALGLVGYDALPCKVTEALQDLIAKLRSVLYADTSAAIEWARQKATDIEGFEASGTSAWHQDLLADGERWEPARLVPSWVDRKAYFELIAAGVVNEELRKRGVGPWEPPERIRASNQGAAKLAFDAYVRQILERETGTEAQAAALVETASKALHGVALMRIEVMNEISMPQVFLWMQESSLFSSGSLLFNPQPGISFRASDLVRNLVLACYMDLPLEDQEKAYHRLWLEPLELRFPGPDAMDSLLTSFLEAKHPGILRQGRRQSQRGLPAVHEGSERSPAGTPEATGGRRHVSSFEKTINSLVEGGAAAGGQQMRGAVLYSKWVSVIQEKQMKAASAAAAAASMPPPPAAPPGASRRKRGHDGGGSREEEEEADAGALKVLLAAQQAPTPFDPRMAVRGATEDLLRDLAAFANKAANGKGAD